MPKRPKAQFRTWSLAKIALCELWQHLVVREVEPYNVQVLTLPILTKQMLSFWSYVLKGSIRGPQPHLTLVLLMEMPNNKD